MKPPRSIGNGCGSPPASGTTNGLLIQVFHASRRLRNTMLAESGVQVSTMLLGPQRGGASSTMSDVNVSRRAVPPADGMTYTSRLPWYSPVNAIHRPSGENRGMTSRPSSAVNRVAAPPERDTDQRNTRAAKTNEKPYRVG